MKITIGTTNPGKTAEIASLLSPLGIPVEPLALDIPETSDTLEGNARLKARGYARSVQGGLVLAEDSGLIVPSLRQFRGTVDLPGAWSARFDDYNVVDGKVSETTRAREVIDPLNNAKVLTMLEGCPLGQRGAYFKIVLVVTGGRSGADGDGPILFETTGEAHGWISEAPRGTNGFGYDPIFIGEDTFGKTYAELDPVRKNLRSHRKKALDHLYAWLAQNLRRLS